MANSPEIAATTLALADLEDLLNPPPPPLPSLTQQQPPCVPTVLPRSSSRVAFAIRTSSSLHSGTSPLVDTLRAEFGQHAVWILPENHSTNNDQKHVQQNSQTISLDTWAAKTLNVRHQTDPWSVETQLCALHDRLPRDIEHVWLIRAEVRCNGTWGATLDTAVNKSQLAREAGPHLSGKDEPCASHADLLATWLQAYGDDPGWYWWERGINAVTPECIPPLARRWKMFDPVVRISRRLLHAVADHVAAGLWTAHPELLFPTLCHARGFVCGNIADNVVGDPFRFGSPMTTLEFTQHVARQTTLNKLYHPVN